MTKLDELIQELCPNGVKYQKLKDISEMKRGTWRINPSMVIKGNRNKEKVLMDEFLATQKEYDKKRKARKNGKKQKTVKG